MNPRVSAIVPLHNHADYVLGALSSILIQDYPVQRIVVVDDGSSDGSSDRVKGWLDGCATQGGITRGVLRGFPIVLLEFDRARGPSFARNQGIRYCWGDTDLFALLDADDLYLPGKIRRSVQKWLQAPEVIGAVYSDYETFNPATGLVVREYKPPYSREHLLRECIVNCDSLVSKIALQNCGLFDEGLRVCEDLDRWLALSDRYLLSHIPEALVRIRVGERSSTSQVPTDTWRACHARVMEKARQRMGLAPL